jgi:regulator of sigma E protease
MGAVDRLPLQPGGKTLSIDWISILAFVGILGLVIVTHELGHFIAAKSCGVKVEEFGLGFPPRIWGFRKGETLYSINWLPFGAFVKMLGEEDPNQPRSLAAKPRRWRLLVLSAGSLTNLILPVILFTISLMVPHQVADATAVQIGAVSPGSPAAAAGIQPGTVILKVNGNAVSMSDDIQKYVPKGSSTEVTLDLLSPDKTNLSVRLVPRPVPPQGEGPLGIQISTIISSTKTVAYPLYEAVPKGAQLTGEAITSFGQVFADWFRGGSAPQMTGPIGVAQMTVEVANRFGALAVIRLAGLISISLGILNLLPLPALDGGRIVFVFLEWLRGGKRVSVKTEGVVHLVGFAILLALIAVISYFDIARIIGGGTLLP